MNYRELMGYPPAEHLMAVLMMGAEEEHLSLAAKYLKEYTLRIDREQKLQVIGPASPYVGKVNDVYRKVLYLKCETIDPLIDAKNKMEKYIEINRGFQSIRIQFDLDPMNIF